MDRELRLMGMLDRLLGRKPVETKDIEPWRGGALSTEHADNFVTNQATIADVRDAYSVSRNGALGLTSTFACVNLIAGTIASLPLMVYRTDAAGVRTVAREHPLYYVLHDSPNFDQTTLDFWEYQAAGLELHGNAYAEIEKRSDGSVVSLTPIRPDIVSARRSRGGIVYDWTVDGKRIERDGKSILHIRGPFGDALSGASTLSVCRSAFDSALYTESAAGTMFRNGIRPSGTLSTPDGVTLTSEQRAQMEEYLHKKMRAAQNAGAPMLLDRGLKWTQLDLSPEDAQMLDSRKFSGEEICRIFGVPPAMVGFGDKASNWGTGKEVDVLGFQKFTLRKRLKRIEQALEKQLLTAEDRRTRGITIEFNVEGLLRADTASRFDAYERGIRMGILTRNEVRALENRPPIEGGDVVTVQMQDVPLNGALTGKEPA